MLVDDHVLVRSALATLLAREPDISIACEADHGQDAVERFEQCRPTVTVMDLVMPVMDGADATAAIRRSHPDAQILVLSAYEGEEDVYRALEAGAAGYVLKAGLSEELLTAIREVARGGKHIPAGLASRLAHRREMQTLTHREMEVLRLAAAGKSNVGIARELYVAESTVKSHMKAILAKLGAADRTEAVAIAMRRGLLHMNGISLDWAPGMQNKGPSGEMSPHSGREGGNAMN
jgi:DNA-binding NarL/FixJ family response regulator